MKKINETSLTRVWQHFSNPNTTIVILTAFRDEFSKKENIQNNKKIAYEIKKAGFGYFYVDGHWIENKGTDSEVKVSEDSIFAIAKENSEKLIKLTHKLANKYNQDAIFIKTKKETYLLYKDGSKDILTGGLKPGKLGDFYTKLRNNKKSNTFVFENERDGLGYFGSFKNYLKNLKEEENK